MNSLLSFALSLFAVGMVGVISYGTSKILDASRAMKAHVHDEIVHEAEAEAQEGEAKEEREEDAEEEGEEEREEEGDEGDDEGEEEGDEGDDEGEGEEEEEGEGEGDAEDAGAVVVAGDEVLEEVTLEDDENIEDVSDTDMSIEHDDIVTQTLVTKADIDSLKQSMTHFATCESLDLLVQHMHLLSTQESVAAVKADVNSQILMSSFHSSELKNLSKVCADNTVTLSALTTSLDKQVTDLADLKRSSSIQTVGLATLTSMSDKHSLELTNLTQSSSQLFAETKSLTQLFVNQGSDLVGLRNLGNSHTDELKQVKDLCAAQAVELKLLKDLFSTITTQGTFVNSLGMKVETLFAESKSLRTQNDALTGHIKGLLKLTDDMSVSFEALELIENKIGVLELNAEKIEVLDEKIINMSKVISSMPKK